MLPQNLKVKELKKLMEHYNLGPGTAKNLTY